MEFRFLRKPSGHAILSDLIFLGFQKNCVTQLGRMKSLLEALNHLDGLSEFILIQCKVHKDDLNSTDSRRVIEELLQEYVPYLWERGAIRVLPE